MTTAEAPVCSAKAPTPTVTASDHILLQDMGWDLYERLLEEIGDRHIYVTYDDGRMEIMAPLPAHERTKKILGDFIRLLCDEREIPLGSLGSTTFRRKDLAKGLEPDECYYIAHEREVRDKDRIDLTVDPPPDLVLEVDLSYRQIDRERIYAALGVPEIWRFDGATLTVLVLRNGNYEAQERSLAFDFLPVRELKRFVDMVRERGETAVRRAFRDWLRTL